MCLAVPGKILNIEGVDLFRTGRVSFGGLIKEVSLAYVPEAREHDYVIVHAGFALARLDEEAAQSVLACLEEMEASGQDLEGQP